MTPEQIEKVKQFLIDKYQMPLYKIGDDNIIQAAYDFAMQSLAETTDEGMLLTDAEADKYCDEQTTCPHETLRNEKNMFDCRDCQHCLSKAQLLKATPIIRAKTAKEIFNKLEYIVHKPAPDMGNTPCLYTIQSPKYHALKAEYGVK